MKKLLLLALALTGLSANAGPVLRQPYEKIIHLSAYISSTQNGFNSGNDYTTAKSFSSQDLMDIPAGVVIEDMYAIVDEAVVGLTAFKVGDDDSAYGFITYDTPLASLGLQYETIAQKGPYFRVTDDGDIAATATVAARKYYSAAGKELKLVVAGTATAGKVRLVIKGYAL